MRRCGKGCRNIICFWRRRGLGMFLLCYFFLGGGCETPHRSAFCRRFALRFLTRDLSFLGKCREGQLPEDSPDGYTLRVTTTGKYVYIALTDIGKPHVSPHARNKLHGYSFSSWNRNKKRANQQSSAVSPFGGVLNRAHFYTQHISQQQQRHPHRHP